MPVYTIASRRALRQVHRKAVADTITDIHCGLTGAPPEFVNVLFMDGHHIADRKQLAVVGNVRSGGNRNRELTDELRNKLHKAIATKARIAPKKVSVKLIGFPASWGMEGGEILPEPGQEAAWLQRSDR